MVCLLRWQGASVNREGNQVSPPSCIIAGASQERRISKSGYDITPMTKQQQAEAAKGLTAHQRCGCATCCLGTVCSRAVQGLTYPIMCAAQPEAGQAVVCLYSSNVAADDLTQVTCPSEPISCPNHTQERRSGERHGARLYWQDDQWLLPRHQSQGPVRSLAVASTPRPSRHCCCLVVTEDATVVGNSRRQDRVAC